MSTENQHSATIPKTVKVDKSINYELMVKEGILSSQRMSGKKWTNFNPSDPGVTMLELLSYALLDLGYKSQFPMKDLLSDNNNQLKTKDKLYKAPEVLYANPLTCNDFRKLLIDRVDDLKNVWIKPSTAAGSFKGTYEVCFEISDSLKIWWINYYRGVVNGDSVQRKYRENQYLQFWERINKTIRGIEGLLYQHRNLGDIFLKPKLLVPVIYRFKGIFYLSKSANVEKTVAWIYYKLNDYLSKFINFYTYDELKNGGLSVGEIMAGPRLENGFIKDEDLIPKLEEIDSEVLKTILSESDFLSSLSSFSVNPLVSNRDREKNLKGKISQLIGPLNAPFFDYTSIARTVQVNHKSENRSLLFYHGDHVINELDQAKINSHYHALTERKSVSSFNFNDKLGPEIPQGTFRDVKKYHSVQHLFPQHFGLSIDQSFEGIPRGKRGQIKQLKGYLMLFEQVIADHQSQIAQLDELLSFKSGVTPGKSLCETYYSQGIYGTPGSKFILKAFDAYKKENKYLDEHPYKNWQAFINDPNNTYRNYLSGIKTTEEKNIKRKAKLLSHVLARYGQKYDVNNLLELNPEYGDYSLARIENISSLLKNFDVYSGNMGRSYFTNPMDCKASENTKEPNPLKISQPIISGLERKLALTYQLNSYYKGIIDVVSHGMVSNSQFLDIEVKPKLSANTTLKIDGTISIDYYGQHILELPFKRQEIAIAHSDDDDHIKIRNSVIEDYLNLMRVIVQETEGFILIDNQLLINNIQSENWTIYEHDSQVVGPIVKNNGPGGDKESIASKMTLGHAQSVLSSKQFTSKTKNVSLRYDIKIPSKTSKGEDQVHTYPIASDHKVFDSRVTLFLPSWVPKVNEKLFKKRFNEQLTTEGPIHLAYDTHYMNYWGMKKLLPLRKQWLRGIKDLQDGHDMDRHSYKAVLSLLIFLTLFEGLKRRKK